MARQRTRPAGCGGLRAINSRFLPLTVRIWAAQSAGFRNPVCSCALVMAELITATAHVRQAPRNGAFLNIRTKWRTVWSLSKPVSYPHPDRVLLSQERIHHAHNLADWRLVRSALAARRSDSRSRGTPSTAKHGKLVVRVRERCTNRISLAAGDRHSSSAHLRSLRQ